MFLFLFIHNHDGSYLSLRYDTVQTAQKIVLLRTIYGSVEFRLISGQASTSEFI